jgi:hypothetical protein
LDKSRVLRIDRLLNPLREESLNAASAWSIDADREVRDPPLEAKCLKWRAKDGVSVQIVRDK